MNTLKSLENRLRGWIPQEPNCTNHFPAQANPKQRNYTPYIASFLAVYAAVFLSMGAMHLLGLGAYDSFAAGISGALAFIAVTIFLNRSHNQSMPITETQKRAAKRIAIVNVGMVVVLLGTYLWVNPNIANSTVTLGLWIALLFACFLVNNLLARNFKKQTLMEIT
ncbi:MAG: hypothetical protein NWF01_10810 [Candidatus Bathyarchaeota archaeon]|nr:hypothetical protein [Candidatus Bathyarchaeota archaeon]